jgi:hypothetical protein
MEETGSSLSSGDRRNSDFGIAVRKPAEVGNGFRRGTEKVRGDPCRQKCRGECLAGQDHEVPKDGSEGSAPVQHGLTSSSLLSSIQRRFSPGRLLASERMGDDNCSSRAGRAVLEEGRLLSALRLVRRYAARM